MNVPEDVMALCERAGIAPARVAHNCHAVSLAIVKSGIYPGSRVARGWAQGVSGQHSWVVADGGPYDLDAHIIDATLWSYDSTVPGVWQGTYREGRHSPHGAGHFLAAGVPERGKGEVITLTADLSAEARYFLGVVGPLDASGWVQVASLPVEGWPAGEVIAAMYQDDRLRALVPIDRVGMLTDLNPYCLYLPCDHPEHQGAS